MPDKRNDKRYGSSLVGESPKNYVKEQWTGAPLKGMIL